MKNIFKIKIFTTVCFVALTSTQVYGNPDDKDENEHRAAKVRGVGQENIQEKVASILNRTSHFQEQVKGLYERVKRKNTSEEGETVFLAYMIRPEQDDVRPNIGHAILSVIDGTEENPTLWAADFSGTHGNLGLHISNLLGSTNGHVHIVDNTDHNNTIFFNDDPTDLPNFSIWPLNAWAIKRDMAERIKQRVEDSQQRPPKYSATGLNINPVCQNVDTYNSSMWAQKILALEGFIKINHMKIVHDQSVRKDSFAYWLVGTKRKDFASTSQATFNEAFEILSELGELIENPITSLVSIGNRFGWVVAQIPDFGHFFHNAAVTNRKRARE